MNRKAKGTRWENEIIKALEYAGFACTRAAGSMGIWDIVAIDNNSIRLIQAKCNGKGSKKERISMARFVCPSNCLKSIWVKYDNEPYPFVYFIDVDGGWMMSCTQQSLWQGVFKEMKEASRAKKK